MGQKPNEMDVGGTVDYPKILGALVSKNPVFYHSVKPFGCVPHFDPDFYQATCCSSRCAFLSKRLAFCDNLADWRFCDLICGPYRSCAILTWGSEFPSLNNNESSSLCSFRPHTHYLESRADYVGTTTGVW